MKKVSFLKHVTPRWPLQKSKACLVRVCCTLIPSSVSACGHFDVSSEGLFTLVFSSVSVAACRHIASNFLKELLFLLATMARCRHVEKKLPFSWMPVGPLFSCAVKKDLELCLVSLSFYLSKIFLYTSEVGEGRGGGGEHGVVVLSWASLSEPAARNCQAD